MAAVDAVCKS